MEVKGGYAHRRWKAAERKVAEKRRQSARQITGMQLGQRLRRTPILSARHLVDSNFH